MTTRINVLDTVSYNPILFSSDHSSPEVSDISERISPHLSIHSSSASGMSDLRPESASSSSFGGRSSSISSNSNSNYFVEDVIPQTEKMVKKVLKIWNEHIECRYQDFKQSSSGKPDLISQIQSDRSYKDNYVELIKRIKYSFDVKTVDSSVSRHVRILYLKSISTSEEAEKNIKAIAQISVDPLKKELYVYALLIAPWNLPMNAPSIFKDHIPEKGAGTMILHSLCATAQKLNWV